jgi:hypothetical protein
VANNELTLMLTLGWGLTHHANRWFLSQTDMKYRGREKGKREKKKENSSENRYRLDESSFVGQIPSPHT